MSEARELGDVNRYQLYDHLKPYTAAPPDVLRVDEKNWREYYILNCCGVAITTNQKDSVYLPADDRRTYVAWSMATLKDPGRPSPIHQPSKPKKKAQAFKIVILPWILIPPAAKGWR